MKKLICFFLILATGFLGFDRVAAQQNANQADLEALYAALKKTPSYKKLKKGGGDYLKLYDEVKSEISDVDNEQAFRLLSKLIIDINDNHLAFYRTPDSTRKMHYNYVDLNLDSIKQQLKLKHKDSIEGIYYSANTEIGIYAKSPGEYCLIGLENRALFGELFKTSYGGLDLIWYGNRIVPQTLVKNVRLVNGALIGMPFSKSKESRFSSLIRGKDNFEFKMLAGKVGYLRLSSFSSNNVNVKKSEEFYAAIVGKLPKQNLIVDLRNNGGGGFKASGKFIRLLKKYKGDIFILQNAATVSNAEQFIVALKSRKNVTTLGEQTKGMITFGSNFGKRILLPSGRFTFYPTDMRGLNKEFVYESKGIDPDIELDPFNSDWIEQTLTYINNKL